RHPRHLVAPGRRAVRDYAAVRWGMYEDTARPTAVTEKGGTVRRHLRRAALAAASVVVGVLIVGSGTGGAASATFTSPQQLPGSAGFGEPSIAIGSGRIVVTAPYGLLTTATTDQPSPVWIS